MSNNYYLPSAIQESGVSTHVIPSAGVQPPVPSAFDIEPGLQLRRVAVTATTFRPAFGCMYAAEGSSGNINTANFFINRTRAYRQRSIVITDPGPTVSSNFWDMDGTTYFPSVSQSGPLYSPTDQLFNLPTDDFRSWVLSQGFNPGSYDGVATDTSITGQTLTAGNFVDPGTGRTVDQSLGGEDDAGAHVTSMRDFLAGLNMDSLWGGSPDTIYHDYIQNVYNASDGDYNDPSYSNLSSTYTQYNTDITNLAADRTTFVNYAYDEVYYPIPNLSGDVILPPGSYGGGSDIGTLQGLSSFGIKGDWSRSRIGFMAHVGASSPGGWSVFNDRVQFMSGTMVGLTVIEQGYYPVDATPTLKVLLKLVSSPVLMPGVIYEIPQPTSFSEPFVSSQGGGIGDVAIVSMDTIVLVNSTIDDYATAYGATATIISAW